MRSPAGRLVALGLVTLGPIAAGGCGAGEDAGYSSLAWDRPPHLYRASGGGTDRVLVGRVRNNSLRELTIEARRLRVLDADGRPLDTTGEFTVSLAHSLYGAYQRPTPFPLEERRRLGLIATIRPGLTAPLVVAFRPRGDERPPLRLDDGKGSLPIPSRVEGTAGTAGPPVTQ